MTRRERFRAYMASMDPATNPLNAIKQGFYVNPPNSLTSQITARFEIDPISRQLIVGGIGSGKSTQLLVCVDTLNMIDDIAAIYVDVSSVQDLGTLRPGCLAALASRELLTKADTVDEALTERVTHWVDGWYDNPYFPAPDADEGWQPGIITGPNYKWPSIEKYHVEDLQSLADAATAKGKRIVFLFDSMDRMTDYKLFAEVVTEDVALLHECGLGVVVVGPIRSLEGFGRMEADRFDHLHFLSPVNVSSDEEGRGFLEKVLQSRVPKGLLGSDASSALIRWSGGVIRDLMSLAKLAGEESYLSGADTIDLEYVDRAADRFGRSLLIGLSQKELNKLKQIRVTDRFVQVSTSDVSMVATRRILKYNEHPTSYTVHPCLVPLLNDVGASDEIPV